MKGLRANSDASEGKSLIEIADSLWKSSSINIYSNILSSAFIFSLLQVSSVCTISGQYSSKMSFSIIKFNVFLNLHFYSFLACSVYLHGKKLSSKDIFSLIYRIRNVSQSSNEVKFKPCGNGTSLFSFLSTGTHIVRGHMNYSSNGKCNLPSDGAQEIPSDRLLWHFRTAKEKPEQTVLKLMSWRLWLKMWKNKNRTESQAKNVEHFACSSFLTTSSIHQFLFQNHPPILVDLHFNQCCICCS